MERLYLLPQNYSSASLDRAGVYRYAESPDFDLLALAYSIDGGPVKVHDLGADGPLPAELCEAIRSTRVQKIAEDAGAARVCLSHVPGLPHGTFLDPGNWVCGQQLAAALGGAPLRPARLEPPTGPTFDREAWKQYCKKELEVFMAWAAPYIADLDSIIPPSERKLYVIDQMINDYGVKVDLPLVENAISLNEDLTQSMLQELRQITGLTNPKNVAALRRWAEDRVGHSLPNLTQLPDAVLNDIRQFAPNVAHALELRKELAKTSPAKYRAILDAVCADGRLRGMFVMNGAPRTGRWSSRIVQLHNLPKTDDESKRARQMVRAGLFDDFALSYHNGRSVLGSLIRTCFIGDAPGMLIVSDYSAIEARVLAWLTGEEWMLRTFAEGKDLYMATAEEMFGARALAPERQAEYRRRGKIAALALGYAGGVNALIAMGALDQGLTKDELPTIVQRYRVAHPRIVELWRTVEVAAISAILYGKTVVINRGVCFSMSGTTLTVRLPSGRVLRYVDADVERVRGAFDKSDDTISYLKPGDATGARVATYGGKLVENIVQAIARDILAEALMKCECSGQLTVVMHVHDEIVAETSIPGDAMPVMQRIFSTPPQWAIGLPLRGDSFVCNHYSK